MMALIDPPFQQREKGVGWVGRIRTYDPLYQKQMPYHLATTQREGVNRGKMDAPQDPSLKKCLLFQSIAF
jgi:hypothetical protein